MVSHQINLPKIFAHEANVLVEAHEIGRMVHRASDIRAAGNEVEVSVRDFLQRMLPPRYHVTHGHLIDAEHRVSPEIDVIIADNINLPAILTTKDGTRFIPVTSVLAVGEVKSTYRRDGYCGFLKTLDSISQMHRPLVPNSCYEGIEASSTLEDLVLGSPRKYLNNLYSFFLCVSGGNFDFGNTRDLWTSTDVNKLPNVAIFLDMGLVAYRRRSDPGALNRYPNEVDAGDYDWCFAETIAPEGGSVEGSNLSFLYDQLISHLSQARLEPPKFSDYMKGTWIARKSTLMWANQ